MFPRVHPAYVVGSDGKAKLPGILGVPDVQGSAGGGIGEIISRTTTNGSEVTNTAAETDLFSFTLSANKLGTTGILLVHVEGNVRNSIGAASSLTLQGYLGSTSLLESASIANGFNGEFEMNFNLWADASASLQEAFLKWTHDGIQAQMNHSEAFAEDTTGDLTVKITAKWPLANAALGVSMRRYYAILYA